MGQQCLTDYDLLMGARRHGQGGALEPPGNVVKCFAH